MGKEADVLEEVTNAATQGDRIGVCGVLAVNVDLACAGLDEPVDHLECRRFATAGRAK